MIDPVLAIGHAFAAAYGLVIGSFLAVCIVRLPEDRSLLRPSACPHCGTPIRWFENVPLASWIALRGRCRSCGARIGPLYPLVELLGGCLAVLVFRQICPDAGDLDLAHGAAWVVRFGFLCLLVVAAAVDVRHRIIPDETSIYAVPIGVAAAAGLGWLGWDAAGWPSWRESILGAAMWGGFFALLSIAGRFVRGEDALGWGDVKLVAMFGAFCGPFGTLVVLMMGSLAGSVFGLAMLAVQRRRTALPFGPPLAAAAAIYVLWGEVLTKALGLGG